jgi:YidC/Oxa1 family membrane protein insertase
VPDIGALYNGLRMAIAIPMEALLVDLYHVLGGVGLANWGLTIIVFTLLVKLVFWPLTMQQMRASRAMQSLQPQLNELKKKHGKDKELLMQEQMRLYKENRVNPMAGCLPMLIQFPIWIGLYQALFLLKTQGELSGGFLWIASLAQPEGAPFILALLTAGSQFVVQRMMAVKSTDPQQQSMNQAMQFMPLMYLVFAYSMPAGLVLYWVVSNVFTLIQQSFYTGWSQVWPFGNTVSGGATANGTVRSRPAATAALVSGESGATRSARTEGAEPTAEESSASATPRRSRKRRR